MERPDRRGILEAAESLEVKASRSITSEVALARLRALSWTWNEADAPEATGEVLHAIYERIVVTGRTIVSIMATLAAYRY